MTFETTSCQGYIDWLGVPLPVLLPTEKDSEEWSAWTPCSVTCGQGERKRTKSCGYSCTLTEASRCDQELCPGELDLAFFFLMYFNSLWSVVVGADTGWCYALHKRPLCSS